MNSKLIIKERKNSYSIFIKNNDEGKPEKIADIYNKEDTLLLSYFIDKFLGKDFNEEEYKNYIIKNVDSFPFINIPKK